MLVVSLMRVHHMWPLAFVPGWQGWVLVESLVLKHSKASPTLKSKLHKSNLQLKCSLCCKNRFFSAAVHNHVGCIL